MRPDTTRLSTIMTPAFDNSYARLPDEFFAKLSPVAVSEPRLIRGNKRVADLLGLDSGFLDSAEGLEILAGNHVPQGAEPLAMVYAGHQFGGFAPQLGDGRAILLGELIGNDDNRYDLQLKGSGRTPYSRGGDGRAWVGPILREYIVSEAMHALGVPTTFALAAVSTGEPVLRDGYMPGALLVRVARSHVRVGTFEFFASRRDTDSLKTLADYAINRLYPDVAEADNPAHALLDAVIEKTAKLVAHWQGVGFVHGVMNTDNTNISGETIDYGPCAFLDTYSAGKVFSSIDHMGRYAFANQPGIAQWNLSMLAQCLMPLMDSDDNKALEMAQASIDAYPACFAKYYLPTMRKKLGLQTETAEDGNLIKELLSAMESGSADFTTTFRALASVANSATSDAFDKVRESVAAENFLQQFSDSGSVQQQATIWLQNWYNRSAQEETDGDARNILMMQNNPAVIPRNHRIEEAIKAATDGDFSPFEKLVAVLEKPFEETPENSQYQLPPEPVETVTRTFCGT